MPRPRVRRASLDDLPLLVRHRRGMWGAISDLTTAQLDRHDPVYRRWARSRLRSGRLIGFIVVSPTGEDVASACLWLMPIQPRPMWKGTVAPYLMSMYTEPGHRGKGYGTLLVREAVRWSRAHGHGMIILHASDFGAPIYRKEGFTRTREMRLHLSESSRFRPKRASRGRPRKE